MNHYVSIWANAMSITDAKPEGYAKNITLRYPIFMPFSASKIQITLDNFTGKEDVTFSQITIAKTINKKDIDDTTLQQVTFDKNPTLTLKPGTSQVSDEIDMQIEKGESISVSIYFDDFTSMRCGVTTSGPLSAGFFCSGNQCEMSVLPQNQYKDTPWFYFLSQVDVYTDCANKCVLCYGDSITAQSWPEELQLLLYEANAPITVVRKAVSGSRILRQYDCVLYERYGLKGDIRFPHEIPLKGCDSMIILQGINDFIHPVGIESNPFRPWSDLADAKTLIDKGLMYYVNYAHNHGYKNVYIGTLLPIKGWRTYASFRNDARKEVNAWIRTTDCIEGYIDFDLALANADDIDALQAQYDSGDHLHPSSQGAKKMAQTAYEFIIKQKDRI